MVDSAGRNARSCWYVIVDWDGVGFAGSRIGAAGVGNCTLVFKTPSTEGDGSPDRLSPLRNRESRRVWWGRGAESNRADGGPVTNVDDANFAVGLSEVNLIPLHNGIGKRAGNGSHGGSVCGVDDFCGGFFQFDCVAHSSNCVGFI